MPTHNDPAYYRGLFERLPTGILIADSQARYLDANEQACALLGRTRVEIIGHHLSEIVAPNRMGEVDAQWRAFLRDGSQTGLFTIRLRDGTVRTIHFVARANVMPGAHCSVITAEVPTRETPDYADLTLCPLTKRVLYRGCWLSIETYLQAAHGLTVRHSVAPAGGTGVPGFLSG